MTARSPNFLIHKEKIPEWVSFALQKKNLKKGGGEAFSLHRRGRGEGGINDNNVINKSSSPAAFL